MKIALFSHVSYPFTNGVAVSVEQLAKTLRDKGHDVTIVSNNYNKFGNDFSNKEDIKVISVPIFYQNLRTPVLINPSLFKELSKQNYDIMHSHSDFGLAMLARTYTKSHNIPLIHTYHCNYLGYAKENFGKHSPILFYEPVKLYTKMLCATTDRMIVPSFETKHLLEDDFKIKKPLDVVPNGIDLSKFSSTSTNTKELKDRYNIKDNDFVILSLSRLSKEKNIDNLITLLPLLRDIPNIKLLIVGGGPEENNLKKLVKTYGLQNVIFTGEVPFSQVQDYYKLGNVFVTCSEDETQGLTVIESLASSLPVICPNTPLYEEIVNNFGNGLLYNNRTELSHFIRMCYYNHRFLNIMTKQAKGSVTRFSLDQSVSRIEEIYQEEKEKQLLLK